MIDPVPKTETHAETMAGRQRLFLGAALALVSLAAAFGVRAMELPKWSDPRLWLDGEYIMATHDAYAWLAGAMGVGTGTDMPLADLARAVSEVFDLPLGLGAFWMPAVFGGLAALFTALWAANEDGLEGAAMAGMAGALAPGFYYRTRLGYYDTDMITLLAPLVVSLALARWLAPWLRSPVDLARGRGTTPPLGRPGLAWPLAAGLLARFLGGDWHHNLLHFHALAALCGLFLVLVLARPGCRGRLAWGLSLFCMAAFMGLPGLALGAAMVLAGLLPTGRLAGRLLGPGVALPVLVVVLAASGPVANLAGTASDLWTSYSKTRVEAPLKDTAPALPDSSPPGPVYPGVTQSVIEAQNMDLATVLEHLSAASWLSVLGLAGFAVALLFRPVLAFLVPLAALALAGTAMGGRTTMFGGPVVALGLALPLCWAGRSALARFLPWRPRVRTLALAAILCLLGGLQVLALVQRYQPHSPTPVLYASHARALQALGKTARPGTEIWTWWDFGYAAMYYPGLPVFADGARHVGRRLFPLALALTTKSPRQAAQMIAFSAIKDEEPWRVWDPMPAAKVQAFVASMADNEYDLRSAPPRYLVVSWEYVRLMGWITTFGTWNLETGSGRPGRAVRVDPPVDVAPETGELIRDDGERVELRTLDVLSRRGREVKSYDRIDGPRLVVNDVAEQAWLLDDLCYGSLMYRLLTMGPDDAEAAKYFHLVHDAAPLVRIFEVVPPQR